MRSRHLTRNGTARVFQIRLPKHLDPDFQLAPIRITLRSVPNSRARRAADILAGLARIEFDRIGVRHMIPDSAAAVSKAQECRALLPYGSMILSSGFAHFAQAEGLEGGIDYRSRKLFPECEIASGRRTDPLSQLE